MSLLALGTEIVECARIAKMIATHGEAFLLRIYTAAEIAHCNERQHPHEHFATRWAAKEAIFKALGRGSRQELAWTDLELLDDDQGRMILRLASPSRAVMQQLGVGDVLVSVAHCRAYATAHVAVLAQVAKSA
jgi:holo-[acyl-carrier protein] synthase